MNVSVEGYMRKEQREEKARIERRRELLTSDVWFKALSQDGTNKDINKKKRKKGFGEKSKPKNVVNQRRNNLFILSFLLPLRCLFS